MFKKIILLFSAFILAFISAEMIVSNILKFPKYTGRKKYVFIPELQKHRFLKWEDPYYTYLNVEAGNQFFSHNNIGLPGSDVECDKTSKYIFVLGSSFIQAHQVTRNKTATAVFQKHLLTSKLRTYQVLNLGASSHDSYLSWFRSRFFEKYFKPDLVILVLERYKILIKLLNQYKSPLKFSLPKDFGKLISDSLIHRVITWILRHSSFLNLAEKGIKSIKNDLANNPEKPGNIVENSDKLSEKLTDCLKAFNNYYNKKFILVSLFLNDKINRELENFCKLNNIKFVYNKKILSKGNRIQSTGHLNEKGNEKLGNFLFDVLLNNIKNK